MGQEESKPTEPVNEFMIRLKNPAQLQDVCSALTQRGMNVVAIRNQENKAYLWVEATPELQAALQKNECMQCEIQPCAYEQKGSFAVRLPRTANLEEHIERFQKEGYVVTASTPDTFKGEPTIYLNQVPRKSKK